MVPQDDGPRMLMADLEPLVVRPWNFLGVMKEMLGVQKEIVAVLVAQDSTISAAVEAIETSVTVGLNLESRINNLWKEVYEKVERVEILEGKMEMLLAAIREEDSEENEQDGSSHWAAWSGWRSTGENAS